MTWRSFGAGLRPSTERLGTSRSKKTCAPASWTLCSKKQERMPFWVTLASFEALLFTAILPATVHVAENTRCGEPTAVAESDRGPKCTAHNDSTHRGGCRQFMMLRLALATLVAVTVLGGCATSQPEPPGYDGPVATVVDSGSYESANRARIFAIAEVDGKRIDDSFGATVFASKGKGFSVALKIIERQVPARPLKVK